MCHAYRSSHVLLYFFFFFQAEDGIRDFCLSRGLGDVYKRQKHIDVLLSSMNEKELVVMEATAEGLKKARETEVQE